MTTACATNETCTDAAVFLVNDLKAAIQVEKPMGAVSVFAPSELRKGTTAENAIVKAFIVEHETKSVLQPRISSPKGNGTCTYVKRFATLSPPNV